MDKIIASPLMAKRRKPNGERIAFTITQTQAILRHLQDHKHHHDCALFCTGVDSMLRCNDLLSLEVADVINERGEIRDVLIRNQEKNKDNVDLALTPITQNALRNWIDHSRKRPSDFLFTRKKNPLGSSHIQDDQYRKVVKQWAIAVGLSPEQYSTHSLRRTKPVFLYKYGFSDIAHIAEMLGHKDTATCLRYLGITKEGVIRHAMRGDIFSKDPNVLRKLTPLSRDFLDPEFLDLFTDEIWERLAPKILQLLTRT